MKPIRKAVIPAAGFGTRFLPATKSIPKEMIPVVDKPVIQYVVEEAIQSGIEEILIITGHGKRAIDEMMYNNQNPVLQQLLQAYEKTGTTIIGCQPLTEEQLMPVDVLEGSQCADSGLIRVHNIQELHKAPEDNQTYNCLGRYIFTPDIFEILNRVEPRDDGEIHLHDALRLMLDRQTIYACPIQGKRYDTANKLDYLKATVEYALRRQDLGPSFREYLKEL